MVKPLNGIAWRRRADATTAPWLPEILNGADNGYFGPGSAAWAVNGSITALVGGIRALLIQALHPGALAGVHDHSRYRDDMIGRLNGTVRWVATTTFGDTRLADRSARAVSSLHLRVQGDYTDARGEERRYDANDPQLMRWVHSAFTEAFLGAHLTWGGRIPGGADRYVEEWARSAQLLGVLDPPTTVAELRAEIAATLPDTRYDAGVEEVIHFLKSPGFHGIARFAYAMMFAGAVASLPDELRERLHLTRPRWPAVTTTRVVLALASIALGSRSPSERAARARAARLAGRTS